jgi:hypothetical protein
MMLVLAITVTSLLVVVIIFGIAMLWIADVDGWRPGSIAWWRNVLRIVRNIVYGIVILALGIFALSLIIGGMVILWQQALA